MYNDDVKLSFPPGQARWKRGSLNIYLTLKVLTLTRKNLNGKHLTFRNVHIYSTMRPIGISNQKGGVGKTTTTANLGACLAENDKKVLLMDMDPQGNLSVHFGVEPERGESSVYTLLRGEDRLEDTVSPTGVDGLHIIASNIDLAGIEVELSREDHGREGRLKAATAGVENSFDYMIIDCPPSLGLLTINAMCAVEEIFIPLQTEFFALQGLGRLMRTAELVRDNLNPDLEVTGIIASMFDVRTSLATEVLEEIKEHFGPIVFDTVIRNNIRLAEAPSYGLPITGYDSTCYGTEDYRSLAREVMEMTEDVELLARESETPPLPGEEQTEMSKAG